jgi:Domain of unknown function (DUF305)
LIGTGDQVDMLTFYFVSQKALPMAATIIVGCVSLAAAHEILLSTSSPSALGHASQSAIADEASYLAENEAIMTRMMNDMTVAPTGDVDRDFVAMMVPHHQGAVEMAVAVLRYGRNEKLKRMAQEIIVTQQQEISAMRLAIGEALPPSMPAPTQQSSTDMTHGSSISHHKMRMHQEH